MKIGIRNLEYEIAHQILISELAFGICNDIKIIPGRGSDFLPYFYNLNFIKGLISLHSLLVSEKKSELSISNYIAEYKVNYPGSSIVDFEKDIALITKSFIEIFPIPLRHKIAAHIDESFTHVDFTSAYIIPDLVPKLFKIATNLKVKYFVFSHFAKDDNPHRKIRLQSERVVNLIAEEKEASSHNTG